MIKMKSTQSKLGIRNHSLEKWSGGAGIIVLGAEFLVHVHAAQRLGQPRKLGT